MELYALLAAYRPDLALGAEAFIHPGLAAAQRASGHHLTAGRRPDNQEWRAVTGLRNAMHPQRHATGRPDDKERYGQTAKTISDRSPLTN